MNCSSSHGPRKIFWAGYAGASQIIIGCSRELGIQGINKVLYRVIHGISKYVDLKIVKG